MPVLLPGILMPWISSGLVAACIIFVIILCVCSGNKEKVAGHGMPGVVHHIDIDKPLLEKPNEPNSTITIQQEEDLQEKTRTVAERALPDIPRVLQTGNSITDTDTDHTPDSGSECYATVTKTVEAAIPEIKFEEVQNGRVPSTRFSQLQKNLSIETTNSTENHMYAQVSKHEKSDRRHTVHCGTILSEPSYPSTSSSVSPPPLPEPEFVSPPSALQDSFDCENESINSEPVFSIAGQAVAGNVPSAEIPYMTPPILENSLLHSTLDENSNPYTTITVREPLERVKKQLARQQMRQLVNRNPSTEEQEGVYTEVPDDQTYAEIDSGQTSAESSTTYDQIEPRTQDLPPDPPTVESLKTVAQAHSRQASIASVSSSGSGNDNVSVGRDVAALYSIVDKSDKQGQTVHVSENINTHNSLEEESKKVEDMYAKVCKKKTANSQSTSCVADNFLGFDGPRISDDVLSSPRSSWSPGSSSTRSPPLPPPLPTGLRLQVSSLDSDLLQKVTRRHSADPNFIESKYTADDTEQDYATVGQNNSANNSSYEKLPFDSDDPGYERIKKDSVDVDPHYERIGQHQKSDQSSSDPGYEHVPGRHVEKSDSIEPGYEQIRKLDRYDSDAVDPGYEKVGRIKTDTETTDPVYDYIPNLSRANSDSGESEYEKVVRLSRYDSDAADPGYERVKLKKTEISQVSRVSIKMDGSLVVQNSNSLSARNGSLSHSEDFGNAEKRAFPENSVTDDSADVITVSECPEKISICINFKPVGESMASCVRKGNSSGMNEDSILNNRFDNGQNSDHSLGIQTATHSSSLSSGDGEDRRSCTATQNSTGYETASSGDSTSSIGGIKKRRILVSSSTKEVTVTNPRGSESRISQHTKKNVWENGQQVYKQSNYRVQTDHTGHKS